MNANNVSRQSPRVLCVMVDGFEEIELVTPVDVLRRAGVEVVIAGLTDLSAVGRCGMRLHADRLLAEVLDGDFDLLYLPGGPGVAALRADKRVVKLAQEFVLTGRKVAAICAAPLILMDAGLLKGKQFTAFPSVRNELGGGLEKRVVVDGSLITSAGAGTALDMGLELITQLCGASVSTQVAKEIVA